MSPLRDGASRGLAERCAPRLALSRRNSEAPRRAYTGDREKCVSLFEWTGDDRGTGMWERRAFFNTRYNGNPATGTFSLPTGRTYLLLCHHKPGNPPPHNDLPWLQSTLEDKPQAQDSDAPAPSATAMFNDGAEGKATVNLKFIKQSGIGRALPKLP